MSKIVIKTQNTTLAKFQILASDSEIDLHSEIQNQSSKSKPLIPFESRFETSKFEFSALDLVGIYINNNNNNLMVSLVSRVTHMCNTIFKTCFQQQLGHNAI